jgi:hypothetical protein
VIEQLGYGSMFFGEGGRNEPSHPTPEPTGMNTRASQ